MTAGRLRGILIAVAVLGLVAASILFFQQRRELPPEYVRSLQSSSSGLTRVTFSSDGEHLLAGGFDGNVLVWKGKASTARRLEPSGSAPLTCLLTSEDGLLLTGESNGRLRAWQMPGFDLAPVDSPQVPITCAAFRQVAGQTELFLGMSDGRLVTIDKSGTSIRKSGHRGVKALLVLPDNSMLLSAGTEGSLIWFDLNGKKAIAESKTHKTEIAAMQISPDGEQLVTGDWNGELRLWSVAQQELLDEFTQPDAIAAIVWHEERIITASWDGRIRSWTVKGSRVAESAGFSTGRAIHGMTIDPKGESLLTVSATSAIDFWKLPGAEP